MFSHQQPSNFAIFSKCLPLFLKDQFLEVKSLILFKRYFLKRSLGGILVVGGNYFKIPLISLIEWV